MEEVDSQTVKNDLGTYDNTKKIATYQGDARTTGCLLDPHFEKYYRLIGKDLSNQQKLDADAKAIQQVNFT